MALSNVFVVSGRADEDLAAELAVGDRVGSGRFLLDGPNVKVTKLFSSSIALLKNVGVQKGNFQGWIVLSPNSKLANILFFNYFKCILRVGMPRS